MSPYLRASVTNFRQSPMSWYEVTPVMKNKMEENGCHCLFVRQDQVNPSFFNRGDDSLFLIRTHSCSTKSKSPRSKKELKMSVSVFSFVIFKKRWRSKKGTTFILKLMNLWKVSLFYHTSAVLAALSCSDFAVSWSSERKDKIIIIVLTNCSN